MPSSHTDIIIFGGGLAGSILAETLIRQGKSVLLVDDPQKSQCSRVAAGLINPIGGKRLNLVWKADALIPFARQYYTDFEKRYASKVYHALSIARLFANDSERTLWEKRSSDPNYQTLTAPLDSIPLPQAKNIASSDGFAIPLAAYLDTNALLDSIHSSLSKREALLRTCFNYSDITSSTESLAWQGRTADYAVFAEGHLATDNPWFNFAPFKPAKGIIGSIESSISFQTTALIREHFIIPRCDGTLTVGATYDWDDRSDKPDASGTQKLETFLDSILGSENWYWKEIRAGVRPATAGAKPIVGPHHERTRLIAFNGFGSKGSMQIPYFAHNLAQALASHSTFATPPLSEVSPSRFLKKTKAEPKRWKATEIARDEILKRLQTGDIAIDATAGNGHDTLWLAQTVGPTGHVHAFDIQAEALEKTQERLTSQNLNTWTSLHHCGHEDLQSKVPISNQGQIAAIVFNLGYLPRGDQKIITRPETTLAALDQSLILLKPMGQLSIVLYPGHQGGDDESNAVLKWVGTLPETAFRIHRINHPTGKTNSPFPFIIQKR